MAAVTLNLGTQVFGAKQNCLPQLRNDCRIAANISSSMDLERIPIRELLDYCLRTNDSAGWKEFTQRTKPTITGSVANALRRRSMRVTPELVEDLTADTHVKLFANDAAALRKLEWPHENSIFKFIKVVAVHVVEDHRRSREYQTTLREDVLEDHLELDSGGSDKLVNEIEWRERWRQIDVCLHDAMGSEPEFPRNILIFRLYYRFDYSAPTIAKLPSIGLDVKKVENVLLRMRRCVTKCFEEQQP